MNNAETIHLLRAFADFLETRTAPAPAAQSEPGGDVRAVLITTPEGKTRINGVNAAARELKVSRQFIHGVVNGKPGFKSARVEAWLQKHARRVA